MIDYRTGNFLDDSEARVFVFPANGVVIHKKYLVMGAGAALAIKKRMPSVHIDLGLEIVANGYLQKPQTYIFNVAYTDFHYYKYKKDIQVVALQTKRDWKENADLDLLEIGLMKFAYFYSDKSLPDAIISMAYPGIGLGGLTKAEVQPLLEKHLGFLGARLRVYDLEATKWER